MLTGVTVGAHVGYVVVCLCFAGVLLFVICPLCVMIGLWGVPSP